jgi:hypothetical protein
MVIYATQHASLTIPLGSQHLLGEILKIIEIQHSCYQKL